MHVGLQTGTWAGTLEALRQLDCPSKRLEQVSGGESYHIPVDLIRRFEKDFEQGFPIHKSPSLAEKYIRGDDISKPVTVFAQEAGISYEEIEESDARILEAERLQLSDTPPVVARTRRPMRQIATVRWRMVSTRWPARVVSGKQGSGAGALSMVVWPTIGRIFCGECPEDRQCWKGHMARVC